MRGYRQAFALLACSLVLLWLMGQANHYLAPFGVQVWLGGLLVTLPALRASLRCGLFVAFTTGLSIDAVTPVLFGTHAVVFAFVLVIAHAARHRFPREDVVVAVTAALFANLCLLLLLTFVHAPAWPDPGAGWLRFFADLVASQVVLTLVAPWFFALQVRAVELTGVHLHAETRGHG